MDGCSPTGTTASSLPGSALPRNGSGAGLGGIAATGDGRAIASLSADAPGGAATFALIAADGTLTSLGAPTTLVFGAGDGLPGPVRMPDATGGLTVAGDGTLLFATDRALRELAAASPRPRVAFTQRAYETFGAGRISYFAPIPGRIEIEVMHGGQTVDRVAGAAGPGEGEIALSRPPGRATYRLRLRLTGATGVADAIATMDTRTALPMKEALASLRTFESSEGDDAGAVGSTLGPCVRETARAVSCLVLDFLDGVAFDTTGDVFHRDVPAAKATATLRADGLVTSRLPLTVNRRAASLNVSFARRQSRRAVTLRIRAGQAADAEAVASVQLPGRRTPVKVRAARRLGRGRTWHARLPMPRAVIAAAARRPLTATVKVTLRRDVGPGIATTWQVSRVTLV